MRVVHYDSESEPETTSSVSSIREQLPLFQVRNQVVDEVLRNRVTILVGETGSGKSTQLPQALLDRDSSQSIVVSQPRRVAAMSLATHVASEVGSTVGDVVGYHVRFASKVNSSTRIRYETDGMLLREFMIDPLLLRFTTVVVDEAHERTVVTDLVLGLLRRVLEKRGKNFRVIVMSATIDADRFADYFGGARKLWIPGRAFHVDKFYLKTAIPSIVEAAVTVASQINSGEIEGGDILIFLPGQEEIEAAAELLRAVKPPHLAPKILPLPLYASLPEKQQQQAFEPPPKHTRKVILATNIAETSVTIPGVRYVVDSGLRKVRRHRAKLGLDSLLPAPISQASAAQRAGRAGREAPGKCFRLYTESTYTKMQAQTEPEITRVNVSSAVLLLKCANVNDILAFEWVDAPPKSAVKSALLQLYALGALDDSGSITKFGRNMALLPLDPPLAAVLVHARDLAPEVREAVIDVAACLSVQDLVISSLKPEDREAVGEARAEQLPQALEWGDLCLLKLVWDSSRSLTKQGATKSELKAWARSLGINFRALKSIGQVRQQLQSYLNLPDAPPQQGDFAQWEELIKAFLKGYVTQTALGLPDRRFQTVITGQPVSIHPGSTLFGKKPPAIMYLEYVYTTREYARFVSPVEIEWLRELAPHLLSRTA